MIAKMGLPAMLTGLLFATAAGAYGISGKFVGGGHMEIGNGSRNEVLPDGSNRVTNGHDTKTCKAEQVAVASGVRITITTTKDTRRYPDGVVACLDLADFGGSAAMSIEGGGVVVKPGGPKP